MSIKHAILGLLAGGPAHGYALKAAFERDVAPLNYGQVHTSLARLEEAGMVTHEVVEQEKQPDKLVYALTAAGRKELHEWLSTPTSVHLCVVNRSLCAVRAMLPPSERIIP